MTYDPVGTGPKATDAYREANLKALKERNVQQPQVSTKKYNAPVSADQQIGLTGQRISLKYPLDDNYLAYIQYRTREVVPADLKDVQSLYSKFQSYTELKKKQVVEAANEIRSRFEASSGSTYDEAGVNVPITSTTDESQTTEARQQAAQFKNRGGSVGLLNFRTQYTDPENIIKLYMPQALQVHDNVQYDQVGLGLAGAAALGAIQSGSGVVEAAAAAASEAYSSFTSLFGLGNNGNANMAGEIGRVAAARAAGSVRALTPQAIQGAIGLGLQVKVNPSTRSIFTGVTVRNFSFVYDFYPTSALESQQVKQIIKTFRKQMYPLSIPADAYEAGFPLGYKFPNLFEIKFRIANQNIDMPQPLMCFLRDVSTTYNPGNMTFHEDGSASHIQMSLQFQEFRALNQQDIDKGH